MSPREGAFARAWARFWHLLPAFVLAAAAVRVMEWTVALPAGMSRPDRVHTIALGALADGLALLAWLPLLFLASAPCLLPERPRRRLLLVGALWSLLVLLQAALSWYYASSGVPLGADLYAYSGEEIRATVLRGSSSGLAAPLALLAPLLVLWAALAWRGRGAAAEASARPLRGFAAACLGALLAGFGLQALLVPGRFAEDTRLDSIRNKSSFFVAASLGHAVGERFGPRVDPASGDASATDAGGDDAPVDPAFPFLHPDRTPDVLGPRFHATGGTPPNVVLIVVEGLGRSFSGPDAALGSFTPFLDELAGRSLYWRNFLSAQGRTFAVFPSLLGSLPFASQGVAALGADIPAHASLVSLLGSQGYATAYDAGFDPAFDNESVYLRKAGVQAISGIAQFPPGYRRMPGSENWGYPDGELFRRYLARMEDTPPREPFLSILQTISMHTPYQVPDQARWDAEVERRLDVLGVAEGQRAAYRQFRAQYASVLYTDAALRSFFEGFARRPEFARTVFVVTGDHRLPEIPMVSRLDRYHVPLLVFSPLLKAPESIGAVSSHFDVAPSLLAWLAHDYGLRTPRRVAWMGSGLDMAPEFRNLHDIPLKQTKTDLRDFVSGEWLLGNGRLYALQDNLEIEAADDPAAHAAVSRRFDTFLARNARFARDKVLAPPEALRERVAYDPATRVAPAATARARSALAVRALQVVSGPDGAPAARLTIANAGIGPGESPLFAPLLVLLDAQARELGESYGKAIRLRPGQSLDVVLPVRPARLAPGRYFLAAFPSHPETGRKLGSGRYHQPLDVRPRRDSNARPSP